MKLEEYLKLLRESGDGELETECGIGDNWPILLKADFDETVRKLLESGNYRIQQKETERFQIPILEHSKFSFLLRSTRKVDRNLVTGYGENDTKEDEFHSGKQYEHYSIGFMMHMRNFNNSTGVFIDRAEALAIEEFGLLAMKEKYPLCFTKSKSVLHREDYSRIVYYPDYLETEIFGGIK